MRTQGLARQGRWRGIVTASIGLGLVLGHAAPATAQEPPADCSSVPWMDTSKSADERAQAVLDASTLQQKYRWLSASAAQNPTKTVFANGRVIFAEALPCLPTVLFSDGPQGKYTTNGVTAFPVPIAGAAAWNTELAEQKGAVHAVEAFDKGSNVIFAPGIASSRTPLSGRTAEYLGEDSLLSGRLAAASVNGIQGADSTRPVVATLKHYVGNEQEIDRSTSNSIMSARTLHQVYTLPFEVALAQSDPLGTMCSFNQINGLYACENPLNNTHLRDTAGFKGWVVSDFNAVHSVGPALKSGVDMELGDRFYIPTKLDAALAAGEITEQDIETAARNTLFAFIEGGLFDSPLPSVPAEDVSTQEHKQVARAMAEQGSVLLKNEGVLPIPGDQGLKIAVIGQTVSNTPTAGVSAKTVCSSWLTFVRGPVLNCEDNVDPLTAFTARAEQSGQTIVYSNGANPAEAAALAAEADIAVVFGYYISGEFADIPDLRFDGNGDELVSAVASANPSTVVVSETGSAVEMPWVDSVAGVVQAWYPGEQGGPALAGLLWGDVNFSGKLPMTFPKSVGDTPTNTPAQYPGIKAPGSNIRDVQFSEGLQVGYKWYDEQGIEPLFEFGHGLTYTDFDYSKLKVKTKVDKKTGAVESRVSFTVTNTGDVAGTEIPQVYLTLPEAAQEPGKRLTGFDRVELAAGETKKVEVVIDSGSANHPFSIWEEGTDAWRILDGSYTVAVGSSSRDLPVESTVNIDVIGGKAK